MNMLTPIDYLLIGHVCYDLTPQGRVIGGTAAYAGRLAQLLGCRTAVLTSADPHDAGWAADLPGVEVEIIPAAATTTFENVYTPQGRVQTLHAVADTLTVDHVPDAWRAPRIVHLGPIANELDPALARAFAGSLVGLTPQGWMRRWDAGGRVYARPWEAAAATLPHATAVILSREDLLDDAMLDDYRRWAPLLALTLNADGCVVYSGGAERHFPAPRVPQVEPTGAGDIFAAAFLARLQQTDGDPWEAARFANHVAAHSVTVAGLDAKMRAIHRALTP
jgi:sugar/nucleoside kinase (ribokinase family)